MDKELEEIIELRARLGELNKKRTSSDGLTDEEERSFAQVCAEIQERSADRAARLAIELSSRNSGEDLSELDKRFLDQSLEALKTDTSVSIELRAATVTTNVVKSRPEIFNELLKPLEAELVHSKLGLKMQTGVHGQPVWPLIAGVEAHIKDEAVDLQDSNISVDKISALPTRAGCIVPISVQAINASNINLRSVVFERMGMALGALLNTQLFSTTAAIAAPNHGIHSLLAQPYASPAVQYAAATGVTFKDVVALETSVLSKNVKLDDSAAYVMNAKMYGDLKSTPIEKGNPRMLVEGGRINGYPVIVTNYMPDEAILFGVFSYAVLAEYADGPRFSAKYDGRKDIMEYSLNVDLSATILRHEAFACLKKK